jgi:tetratricopeptide (TPR) repeat protein
MQCSRASDALAAALAAQRALQSEPWGGTGPLRARMALHSGVAQLRDGDYYGATLNRVARILALGHGAQILLSHATHDLVVDDLPPQASLHDLGEYQLKDLSRPEQLFQLVTPDIRSDFPPLRAVSSASIASAREPAPLLTSKLHIPSPRPQVVLRSHQLLNSADYFFGMADLLRELNDLDAAEEYLRQGLNVTLGTLNVDADVVQLGYMALARLLGARGQHDEAFALLETFGQLARERRFSPLIRGRAAAGHAQLALAHGDLQAAVGWAEASGLQPDQEISFQHEAEYLTLARVLIARSADQPTRAALPDAVSLLNRLLVSADAAGRMRSAVEILALQALAFQLDGNTTGAIASCSSFNFRSRLPQRILRM